jgi:hypothetical protein
MKQSRKWKSAARWMFRTATQEEMHPQEAKALLEALAAE